MNNILKNVLVFGAGLTIGVIGAVLVMKNRYEAILDEEIDSMRDHFKKKEEQLLREVKDIEGDTAEETSATTMVRSLNKKKQREILDKCGYDKVDRKNNIVTPDEEDEEEYRKWEKISEETNTRNNDNPHVITLEQFSEENDHYDKLTISYYHGDSTLADDNEEIIEDPESFIGDALYCFGLGSEDDDVVYVRNDKLQIDYEIVRSNKKYSEEVLGMNSGGEE